MGEVSPKPPLPPPADASSGRVKAAKKPAADEPPVDTVAAVVDALTAWTERHRDQRGVHGLLPGTSPLYALPLPTWRSMKDLTRRLIELGHDPAAYLTGYCSADAAGGPDGMEPSNASWTTFAAAVIGHAESEAGPAVVAATAIADLLNDWKRAVWHDPTIQKGPRWPCRKSVPPAIVSELHDGLKALRFDPVEYVAWAITSGILTGTFTAWNWDDVVRRILDAATHRAAGKAGGAE